MFASDPAGYVSTLLNLGIVSGWPRYVLTNQKPGSVRRSSITSARRATHDLTSGPCSPATNARWPPTPHGSARAGVRPAANTRAGQAVVQRRVVHAGGEPT